jgi:hypothetical protein
MRPIATQDEHASRKQQRWVKVAGVLFLSAFILPTLNWMLVLSRLVDSESAAATTRKVLNNEWLFRLGTSVELFMAISLLVLAVALYAILKTVDRNLALLALTIKSVEAGLCGVLVLLSFLALQLSNGATGTIDLDSIRSLVGVLLNQHTVLYAIPMVLLGLDMMLFFYLFLKSGLLPRGLALFGIFSFACIFVHSLGHLLAPDVAAMPVVAGIFYAPSCLAELIVGSWLLAKGTDIHKGRPLTPAPIY